MRSALLACLLLVACAPLAEMRPASGIMEGRSLELGTGVVRVGPRPYVDEAPSYTGLLWFSGKVSRRVTLSAVSAFDRTAPAGGGAIRFDAVRVSRFAGGVELQAGYAWAASTLPFAFRLFDETWIYANPRLGTIGRYLSFSAPVGLDARIWEGLKLRFEAQTSWEEFKYYNRRVHLAGGVAYQW